QPRAVSDAVAGELAAVGQPKARLALDLAREAAQEIDRVLELELVDRCSADGIGKQLGRPGDLGALGGREAAGVAVVHVGGRYGIRLAAPAPDEELDRLTGGHGQAVAPPGC